MKKYNSIYLPSNKNSYNTPGLSVTSPGVPSQDFSPNSQPYSSSNVAPSSQNLGNRDDLEALLQNALAKNKDNEDRANTLQAENNRLKSTKNIKEYEDQIAYYEVKVKDLEERIPRLSAENNKLTFETNRLNNEIIRLKLALAQVTDKERELEDWKRKHDEVELRAKREQENIKSAHGTRLVH